MTKPVFLRFAFLALGVLFVSCASAPRASFSGEEKGRELSVLPAGAKVYLWADAVKARPLLDVLSFEGISGKDAADVLDSTDSAAAAFFPGGQGRRFFLAAVGAYPRVRANLSLTFSKDWKKQKSPGGSSFWFSQRNNIALALGSNLALVSDTDPFGNFPAETVPSGFTEFSRGLALAGWITNPSDSVDGFLSSLGIPLQVPAEELFFGAEWASPNLGSRGQEPWTLVLRVKTPTVTQARSLLALFSVARFFVMSGLGAPSQGTGEFAGDAFSASPLEAAALLFANAPELDGDSLTLRTGSLDEGTIALLFNMISVYSR